MSSSTPETTPAGALAPEAVGPTPTPGPEPSAAPAPVPVPPRSVPEGVTVVFAERKRTGRVAGAKYKADGTLYKKPGPAPKPAHERAAAAMYKHRGPVKRMERSYTEQKRREVVMFLQSHKIRIDEEARDTFGRKVWYGGREDQQPPEEKGYRWPTLREASEWFKIPERTIHSWWKRRDKIFGNAPKRMTKAEKRKAAEDEERRRREAEERRVLLEAIGWPREALPAPGDAQAPVQMGMQMQPQIQMQTQGQSEPVAAAVVAAAVSTPAEMRSLVEGMGVGGALSIPEPTPVASLPNIVSSHDAREERTRGSSSTVPGDGTDPPGTAPATTASAEPESLSMSVERAQSQGGEKASDAAIYGQHAGHVEACCR